MHRASVVFLAVLTGFSISQAQISIPAFPTAEGFGAFSVGGRGGKVLFVTNLNDDGPGSLRDAVNSDGPRTVIFRVSGTIALKSNLSVTKPYITIAGQTAPGDGICLKDHALAISADHVIVRYLRCRPGDNVKSASDAISISSGKNIIVDHCSASWSVDETLSASTGGQLGNLTVQWCIISESLNDSTHSKGPHGYGSLIRGGWGNGYTFHHNLYAHHHDRLPRPGNYNNRSRDPDGFIFDFRNNVIYNWAGRVAGYNSDGSNGTDSITKMNFVANYYKSGVNSTGTLAFAERTKTSTAYFSGNCMNGSYPDDPWSLVTFGKFSPVDLKTYKQSTQIPVAPVKTDDAITACHRVLSDCGATLPKRDAVDIRIIDSVKNKTGRIINDEDEVGGWPDLKSTEPPPDSDKDGIPDNWEKRYGFDSNNPEDRNDDPDKDGYTNLEEYLNNTKPLCIKSQQFGATRLDFPVGSGKGFVILPTKEKSDDSRPWMWIAPTFVHHPQPNKEVPRDDHAWICRQLLAGGFHICGVDVGESYGNPEGRRLYSKLYELVLREFELDKEACLLCQSRGGLMAYN